MFLYVSFVISYLYCLIHKMWQVLLALERIEQDEELTFEVLNIKKHVLVFIHTYIYLCMCVCVYSIYWPFS